MNTDDLRSYEEAFQVMKKITERGASFKIAFRKSSDGGKRIIYNARLRGQSKSSDDTNSNYKIQLTDMDTGQPRSCYIPLLLSINDQRIIL